MHVLWKLHHVKLVFSLLFVRSIKCTKRLDRKTLGFTRYLGNRGGMAATRVSFQLDGDSRYPFYPTYEHFLS